MKYAFLIAFCTMLFGTSQVHAQLGGHSVGDYFLEDGYSDDLSEAVKNPDAVIYLDLSLRSPKLTETPDGVYTCTKVKELDLSYNRVKSVGDGIGNLTDLELIDLSGNHYLKNISDEIAKCTKLKEIRLKDTGISAEQKKHLKSILPEGCAIVD